MRIETEDQSIPAATVVLSQLSDQSLLGVKIHAGVFWNIAGQIGVRCVNLLFMIVLARVLMPRDFGLLGLANVVIGFVAMFSNIGVGAGIIQRQCDVNANVSAAFYMNLITITLMTMIVFIASPWAAGFYNEPLVEGLLWVLGVAFFFHATVAVHEAFLRKQMAYKKLQLINLGSSVTSGIIAVVLAWRGWGAWSIAFGFLGGNFIIMLLFLFYSGMPLSLNPCLDRWKDLFVYARHIFFAGIIWYFVLQGDSFVVGKFLGASALGVYALAYNYGRVPQMLIGAAVGDVMFSAFSRVQHQPETLRQLLLKSMRYISVAAFPLAAIMYLMANDLIPIVFGERWSEAIVPFQIFSAVFSVLMISAPFSSLYQAINKPSINLVLGIVTLPVFAVALTIGLQFGLVGVVLGVSCLMILLVLSQIPLVAFLINVRLITMLRELAPAALCIVIAVGITLFISRRIHTHSIVSAFILSAVYLSAMKIIFPYPWKEVRIFISRYFQSTSRSEAFDDRKY